ncbi:hypothetical protein MKZ38_004902 [Zalerion maritima]|uniref:Mitotic checkpoint regulator, MAD2B-interacting-domain-containing protein n=1 Tax=Zalerion maritima TaxID=339359 RepID=A0AAD5WUX4_9PEZI|nr:hypothetical protein MKZ38_004902 [Zalerion maritima]
MGLVDYSDSESDSELQTPAASTPRPTHSEPTPQSQSSASAPKKPFHKLLDQSNTGQILVSLPKVGPAYGPDDEPPAKRVRTADKSSFSGFNSFLPAPKRPKPSQSRGSAPKPVGLRTSADTAFSRENEGSGSRLDRGLGLPSPNNNGSASGTRPGPKILEDQKPAEEVKLVGKPLMFKPLSVTRRPGQKKTTASKPAAPTTTIQTPVTTTATNTAPIVETPPPKKSLVSFFSFDEPPDEADQALPTSNTGAYEPIIATDHSSVTGPFTLDTMQDQEHTQPRPPYQPTASGNPESLTSIADTMNLSAAERRELFGRAGPSASHGLQNVVNLNMDREYAANEVLRASGETVQHNPLRSIAPGKHSLKQLVNAVQNQKDALEESFAKGKSNRKEAAGRYGWK